MARYAPIHPGEILKTEFLDELGITPYALAKNTGIDKGNLSRIINGKSAISADTALRLARFFGTSADSWMNLQRRYDLDMAKDHGLRRIEREVCPYDSMMQGTRT
ncbi:MAG: HigA family addiction module antidote protein [Proteobacteria bacterium]|nr:HigA family addiction module antidote protein [Pseudomonadota bacterium]